MSGSAHSKAIRWARISFLAVCGKKRAGFHGRVVGDDHARNAGDIPDAGDGAGGGNVSPLLVHLVGGPKPDFKKGRTRIEELADALAREQTTHLVLAVLARFAAAFAQDALLPGDRGAALAQASGGGAGDRDMTRKAYAARRTESSASAT